MIIETENFSFSVIFQASSLVDLAVI